MDRRDFMKLAGAAGLMLAAPVNASAQEATNDLYEGKFYVFCSASGGYDPTFFCDPKGFIRENEDNPMHRTFAAADVGMAGNIPYAPVGYYSEFAQKHFEKMLVINGVDTETNGHDSGARNCWSGHLAEGYPSFGALVAAEYGVGLPMSYISNGYYDETAGKIAKTRVSNVGVFERIALPNAVNPGDPERGYHTADTFKRIREAQQSRLLAKRGVNKLPKLEQSMGTLHIARSSDNVLGRLLEFLPDQQAANGMQRQAQLAVAAYKAGACVSANLTTGGFDTHGNHDQNHLPRLDTLWQGVDFLFEEAERQGVVDQLVVVVGSDFGRTPGYNDNNGKDHWSVTSMILMGSGIRGNRVIGQTTERHSLLSINPTTLALDESASGIRITPAHIHKSLRKLAGLEQSRLNAEFRIDVANQLDLLS